VPSSAFHNALLHSLRAQGVEHEERDVASALREDAGRLSQRTGRVAMQPGTIMRRVHVIAHKLSGLA